MTQVDPWLSSILSQFTALDDDLANIERLFMGPGVRGRSRSIARELGRSNLQVTNSMNANVRRWAESGLQDAYMRGAIAVSGDPLKMTRAQRKEFSDIQKDVQKKLLDSVRYQQRDTERFIKVARKQDNPTKQWLERNQIKGAKFSDGRRMDVDAYARMESQTAAQRMRNLGTIHAAQALGIQFVECQDSPECGWDGHHDSDKANGRIVATDGSDDIILTSHPYCVRTFVPRPDLNKGGLERLGEKVLEALKTAAIETAKAQAIALAPRLLFVVEEEVVDEELANQVLLFGSRESQFLTNMLNRFQNIFTTQRGSGAEIIPFVPEPPPPIAFPQVLGQTGTEGVTAITPFQAKAAQDITTALNAKASVEELKDRVLKWGDALLDKRISFDSIPESVKAVVGATNNDSENVFMDKVRQFADLVQKERAKKAAEEGARVLNFILKKKQWNEFNILKAADRFATEVRGTWTQYGPRVRVDLTDFLRGNVTFTKDGIRRSITLDPAQALRSTLGVTQDGTLIGSLRLVPSRIFSAAIEINDFGNLEAEARFNPFTGGRLRMLFEAPRPKNWYNEGLLPGQDFVDFREAARSVAGHSEPWTADLQTMTRVEMQKKWRDDANFHRFNELLDMLRDDTKFATFAEKVDQAVADGFTDDSDVRLWLSVIADTPERDKRLYRGFTWIQDETLPQNMTRAEQIRELGRQYPVGERIDEFVSDWYTSRGTALDFGDPGTGEVGVLYRVASARGVPTGALGTVGEGLSDQVVASGSYVVRNSKFDAKLKRFVVDLEYLGPQVDEALAGRRFGVEDFTFREFTDALKQMRPKEFIFDIPIFNKSIFNIASEIKIPIADVRRFVAEQVDRGLMRFTEGGRYSGMLSFNPGADLINMISDQASKTQITGDISFSQFLPSWAGFLEPKVGATWTRSLVEVAGKESQMQKLIANVRLSGLEFFERATNMELGKFFEIGDDMWGDFTKAVRDVDARIHLFLIDNQRDEVKLFGQTLLPKGKIFPVPLMRPRDIAPLLEKRMASLITARPDIKSREMVFRFLVEAIRGISETTVVQTDLDPDTGQLTIRHVISRTNSRPMAERVLREIAGILPEDTKAIVERKLQDLVFFLNAATMDTPGINEIVDAITRMDLSLAAFEMTTPR